MRRLAAKVATRPGSTDVVAASTFHSSACPAPATANRQIFSFGVNTYGVSLPPPDGVLIEPASASGAATITRIIGIKNAQLLDGRCGRVRSLPPPRAGRPGVGVVAVIRAARKSAARVSGQPLARQSRTTREDWIGIHRWLDVVDGCLDGRRCKTVCKIGAMMEEILRPKGTQYDTG